MMPDFKHGQPCNDCPWRRKSSPGWLGDSNPEHFIAATQLECHMPCHATVDYEDKDWFNTQYGDAPLCAGALIFLANTFKAPRDAKLAEAMLQVERDTENVFASPQEFLDHHHSTGQYDRNNTVAQEQARIVNESHNIGKAVNHWPEGWDSPDDFNVVPGKESLGGYKVGEEIFFEREFENEDDFTFVDEASTGTIVAISHTKPGMFNPDGKDEVVLDVNGQPICMTVEQIMEVTDA